MSGENARTIERVILRALADNNLGDIAEATSLSLTRVSRWKNDDTNGGGLNLPAVSEVLSALGLAVIDARNTDLVTTTRDEYQALLVLASVGLKSKFSSAT